MKRIALVLLLTTGLLALAKVLPIGPRPAQACTDDGGDSGGDGGQ
jgi:hypothetical protein